MTRKNVSLESRTLRIDTDYLRSIYKLKDKWHDQLNADLAAKVYNGGDVILTPPTTQSLSSFFSDVRAHIFSMSKEGRYNIHISRPYDLNMYYAVVGTSNVEKYNDVYRFKFL